MTVSAPLPWAVRPPRLRVWLALLALILAADGLIFWRVFGGRVPFNYRYDITPKNAERLHRTMQDVYEGWPDTRDFMALILLVKFDIGVQALPTLIEYTTHEAPTMRRVALGAIGALEDPSATPAVLERMDDPESLVVFSACMTLGDLGDRRALDRLVEAMDHPDYRVRAAAALNVSILGPRARDVEALIAHIEDPHNQVGGAIQNALSEVCHVNPRFLGRSRALWQEWWQTTGRETVVLLPE